MFVVCTMCLDVWRSMSKCLLSGSHLNLATSGRLDNHACDIYGTLCCRVWAALWSMSLVSVRSVDTFRMHTVGRIREFAEQGLTFAWIVTPARLWNTVEQVFGNTWKCCSVTIYICARPITLFACVVYTTHRMGSINGGHRWCSPGDSSMKWLRDLPNVRQIYHIYLWLYFAVTFRCWDNSAITVGVQSVNNTLETRWVTIPVLTSFYSCVGLLVHISNHKSPCGQECAMLPQWHRHLLEAEGHFLHHDVFLFMRCKAEMFVYRGSCCSTCTALGPIPFIESACLWVHMVTFVQKVQQDLTWWHEHYVVNTKL